MEALRGVKLRYIGAALAVMLLTAYLDALALWLPLNRAGVPGSRWAVFEIKMIGGLFDIRNLLAPSRVNGPVRSGTE